MKIKLRWLKGGVKRVMLSAEVPSVLYQAIASQKSSRQSLLFQLVNFAGSQCLVTTLKIEKNAHTCRTADFIPKLCIQIYFFSE